MFDHGDGGARPEESIDDGDSVETREDKEYFLQDPSNRKGICYSDIMYRVPNKNCVFHNIPPLLVLVIGSKR